MAQAGIDAFVPTHCFEDRAATVAFLRAGSADAGEDARPFVLKDAQSCNSLHVKFGTKRQVAAHPTPTPSGWPWEVHTHTGRHTELSPERRPRDGPAES